MRHKRVLASLNLKLDYFRLNYEFCYLLMLGLTAQNIVVVAYERFLIYSEIRNVQNGVMKNVKYGEDVRKWLVIFSCSQRV